LLATVAGLVAGLAVTGAASADSHTFGANYGYANVTIEGGPTYIHLRAQGQTATGACTYVRVEIEIPWALNHVFKTAETCAPRSANTSFDVAETWSGWSNGQYAIVKFCRDLPYKTDACVGPHVFNF
jgi:hypothetical protein